MPIFTALLSLFSGLIPSIKDYVSYKQQVQQKEQDYKLALLQSQVDMAKSQAIADSNDLKSRLDATSQDFKQETFWLLWIPVVFSVIFPLKAQVMWANFSIMPEWFQWLFLSVYSSIWGIPIVKGGYGAVTDLLSARRDFKLEKERINRQAVFDSLRHDIFTQGLNQQQVEAVDRALDKGEQQ